MYRLRFPLIGSTGLLTAMGVYNFLQPSRMAVRDGVFDQNPANANTLRHTIDRLNDGSYQTPGINTGDTKFRFTGGEVASAFPNLNDLWDAKKQWNNDAGRHEWDINLPVYQEGGSCSNPSGSITTVGYAKAVMVNVKKKIFRWK